MHPDGVTITLSGKTYELAFTLDAIDRICAVFGCAVGDIRERLTGSDKPDFRASVITMLVELINSAIDLHNEDCPADQWEPVTESWLKRRMTQNTFADAYGAMVNAYLAGFVPDAGAKDEDDIGADPNQTRAT